MAGITILINSLGGGGAEGVCASVANKLAERGWKITLLVLHINDAVKLDNINKGVDLVVLGKTHARSAPFSLARFFIKNRPDRILVFNHQLAILLVLLRPFFLFRFKIIARNINTLSHANENERSFWHKYIVQRMTKIFYRKVDKIISQSNGMAEDLVNHYRIPMEKITIVNNPINYEIDKHFFSGPTSQKQYYLLCMGRLEPQKAFHYAIKGFSLIANDYPDLRLKFVGKGSLENELKEQARLLRVADKIDFEGYQVDIIPYYLGAKATLLTSLYEGFPNVLVESIALGTPIVSFDCPSGPSEIVVEGVNGYLVETGNVDELVKKIRIVMDNAMDSDTVRKTSERFGLDRIVDEYESVISSV